MVNERMSTSELDRVAERVARRRRRIAFQRQFERQNSLKNGVSGFQKEFPYSPIQKYG